MNIIINRFYLGIFLISLSLLFSIHFIYIAATSPYFLAEVTLNNQNEFVVTHVDETGAAFEIGIRENDIILTVNGNKVENHFTFKKFEMIEQVKTVVYKHDTE